MTLLITLHDEPLDARAVQEARRQYDRAVERHFIEAHRLVAEGEPDAAERIAKGAVALRMDAYCELRESR